MEKEYKYFQTWQLQLLTRFMLDDTPIFINTNKIALINTEPQTDQLWDIILGIRSTKFNIGKDIFSCTLDRNNNNVIIKLAESIKKDYIRKNLQEYAKAFENDEITSNNDQKLSFKSQVKGLLHLIKDEYNLKDFKLKEWKYLPVIIVGFFHKLVEIRNISVSLPLTENHEEPILAVENLVGENLDMPIFYDEFLDFNCILDITKLSEKYSLTKEEKGKGKQLNIKNNILRKDKKFSEQQTNILNFIIEEYKNGHYSIPTEDFKQFIEQNNYDEDSENVYNAISRAIYKLNKQYQCRFNKKQKVITKGNKKATYDITKSFQSYLDDNYAYIDMIFE